MTNQTLCSILTYSGQYVDLREPNPETIQIVDIAHALSQINRFGGHTRNFYSVAQHSVLVSHIVPREHRLAALLHDAAEAYLGDIVMPLKRMAFNLEYRDMEDLLLEVILERFGIVHSDYQAARDAIRQADLVMLATERRDLMHPDNQRWAVLDGVEPRSATIRPLLPVPAEAAFLQRFKELSGVL
ncbi:hypothetical protein EDC30_109125 [Paucimonas lemoignei]|uniref:Phosphohydrolase n=1 Tax=Paucimonas lemoignei TaxID=29443 RepID=A0A4R3HRS2_PAULE|nr:hypothetical protein [Paucimonas lemoignei]TCS35826.1 hypothetical protein EDC30_109125 [Paucimonas lemoignei]